MGVDARMIVKTIQTLTPRELKRISFEMCGAFGADKFMLSRDSGDHALTLVDTYEQNGEEVPLQPGEQIIEVAIWSPYYGPDYERGDFPFIVALAKWLEARIPGASVLYGGDSSGVSSKPFNEKARNKMFAHFVEHGHRPYWMNHNDAKETMKRHCDFCDEPMVRRGWGGNYAVFCCAGCGADETSRDGGTTWRPTKEDRIDDAK